jgi:hypothetical protein
MCSTWCLTLLQAPLPAQADALERFPRRTRSEHPPFQRLAKCCTGDTNALFVKLDERELLECAPKLEFYQLVRAAEAGFAGEFAPGAGRSRRRRDDRGALRQRGRAPRFRFEWAVERGTYA